MSNKIIIENPMIVVAEQAEDEGIWFFAEHITESILQQALRRLHAAVEGVPFESIQPKKYAKIGDCK